MIYQNMTRSTHLSLLLFLIGAYLIEEAFSCKVAVIVRSKTKQPFKIRIAIPSAKAVTEDVQFSYEGQQKQVLVDGGDCLSKHWVFKTFKQGKNGKWKVAKEGKAKLDGSGRMVVNVNDDLEMRIGERFSVFCSESVICG